MCQGCMSATYLPEASQQHEETEFYLYFIHEKRKHCAGEVTCPRQRPPPTPASFLQFVHLPPTPKVLKHKDKHPTPARISTEQTLRGRESGPELHFSSLVMPSK